jgi:hypothetical protein
MGLKYFLFHVKVSCNVAFEFVIEKIARGNKAISNFLFDVM